MHEESPPACSPLASRHQRNQAGGDPIGHGGPVQQGASYPRDALHENEAARHACDQQRHVIAPPSCLIASTPTHRVVGDSDAANFGRQRPLADPFQAKRPQRASGGSAPRAVNLLPVCLGWVVGASRAPFQLSLPLETNEPQPAAARRAPTNNYPRYAYVAHSTGILDRSRSREGAS